MARQPRKRQHVDDRSRSETEPPAKKTKTRGGTELKACASWTYPPEFWDRLSEISLTHRAVEEHNRRLRLQHHPSPPLPWPKERAEHLARTFPARDLARFARQGGPDLSDLRGYPITKRQPSIAMSASQSWRSRATKSTDPASALPTSATTKTTKTKKSTAYDANFDFHLTDHGVHAVYSSQRPDLTEVRAALTVARPSLSPSRFSEGAFEAFQEVNARAKDEDDMMAHVVPTILGPYQPAHPSTIKTMFTNLEPLTDGTIAVAVPDIYYGAGPGKLARPVRDELRHHIMPSTTEDKPWVPNFSVEVKGPDGSAAVATRQVRYYGAVGSRAMHSLQNYREEEPTFDGQAYTYSSTYHDGMLKLYAHHITAPTEEDGRPEYHMTQVKAYAMTSDRETFLQGATAFRNTRDLAKRHRDGFIQAANVKASQSKASVSQDIVETLEEGDPTTDPSECRDSELQQHIANANGYGFKDDSEATAVRQYLSIDGDLAEPSQDSVALRDDPSLDFASSFTSSFSSAKRPRQSVSSPSYSRESRSSKSQKRSRKRRMAESTTALAAQLEPSEAWEDTY
ncbi:hypothetical protein F5Y09DRAFT_322757 [Xylaria sp. FL1042]|nr:hypothetical protein F5Y09DRAFT_322757 [Xylaria sp. FL1042]